MMRNDQRAQAKREENEKIVKRAAVGAGMRPKEPRVSMHMYTKEKS